MGKSGKEWERVGKGVYVSVASHVRASFIYLRAHTLLDTTMARWLENSRRAKWRTWRSAAGSPALSLPPRMVRIHRGGGKAGGRGGGEGVAADTVGDGDREGEGEGEGEGERDVDSSIEGAKGEGKSETGQW